MLTNIKVGARAGVTTVYLVFAFVVLESDPPILEKISYDICWRHTAPQTTWRNFKEVRLEIQTPIFSPFHFTQ